MVPSLIQSDSSQATKGVALESETAAVTGSLLFGTDRMTMRPGSEKVGPVMPSLTGLQSNQMLISHSNQMGFHKSSVVPIHPAELGREIYDMESTQYSNINFSAHGENPGGKTAVPMRISVPVSVDQWYPTQDSLHSPGPNGKVISNSWSNSTSDETEDWQVIAVRKKRKMLSNRESARRSRLRKQLHLDALKAQVAHLRAENAQIVNNFNIAAQQYAQIIDENSRLRSHALDLIHKLQRLHHTINAQSHCAFNTESGTIAQCLTESSDHLF